MVVAPVRIENEAIAVTLAPDYGARVTSLIDKATGRDWIAPGGRSTATGEDAVYLADEAVGWDECFPTVGPWDATGTVWGRRLRDHGDLWGRPWNLEDRSPTKVAASYMHPGTYRFARTLFVRGATLHARYSVTNLGSEPLPFLWALHALLAVGPDDRIALPGVATVAAPHLVRDGEALAVPPTLPWPAGDARIGFPLDAVQPASAGFAGKFYASDLPAPRAAIGDERGTLEIGWEASVLTDVGLWLTYGGWPRPGGAYQVAIEPTTAAADDLGQAIATGNAAVVAPGARHNWTVTLGCRSGRPA